MWDTTLRKQGRGMIVLQGVVNQTMVDTIIGICQIKPTPIRKQWFFRASTMSADSFVCCSRQPSMPGRPMAEMYKYLLESMTATYSSELVCQHMM